MDVTETNEWLEALLGVAKAAGKPRARFLLQRLAGQVSRQRVKPDSSVFWLYQNIIALEHQPIHHGDRVVEERIASIIRTRVQWPMTIFVLPMR